MSTYPHKAAQRLEDLEPINAPKLHDRIYEDILVRGLEYRQKDADGFADGIALLRKLRDIHAEYVQQAGPFADLFGEYLECSGQTSERAGQFFTPPDIVDMMVEMTFNGVDLARERPFTVCDPACGSGRFMLGTAKHFVRHNAGCLNFLFTNVDIDRKAFTYCTMNAVLNGIPGIHIHGDTLRMEVWDAFATLPVGTVAMWERVQPETAKRWLVSALERPDAAVAPESAPSVKTRQTTLEGMA